MHSLTFSCSCSAGERSGLRKKGLNEGWVRPLSLKACFDRTMIILNYLWCTLPLISCCRSRCFHSVGLYRTTVSIYVTTWNIHKTSIFEPLFQVWMKSFCLTFTGWDGSVAGCKTLKKNPWTWAVTVGVKMTHRPARLSVLAPFGLWPHRTRICVIIGCNNPTALGWYLLH